MITTRVPGEIWRRVFILVSNVQDKISCALVCKNWCLLTRETIDDTWAREVIHPLSFSSLRHMRLNEEWLEPCLTFILTLRCKFLVLEKLEICGATYAHRANLLALLQYINHRSLTRVEFLHPHIAPEKYVPEIFTTFANITEFKIKYDNDVGFRRRTLSSVDYVKVQAPNLTTLQLRLSDHGFNSDTNTSLVRQLVSQSPCLQVLLLDRYTTLGHETIVKYCIEHCKQLKVLSMTHEGTINTLLADVDVQADCSSRASTNGLRVYAASEYCTNTYTTGIGQNLIASQETLEVLYLESLAPTKKVSWPSTLPNSRKPGHDIKFPRLRYLTLHLGWHGRDARIETDDLEEQIYRTLLHSHQLESFTYRRGQGMRSCAEKTRITDRILESLEHNCPKLRTFRVTNCYDFDDLKLHRFLQAFSNQLSVVEFDCTIRSTGLLYILRTLKSLHRFNLRHVCNTRKIYECSFAGNAEDILIGWGGHFSITLNQTLYFLNDYDIN